MEDIFSFSDEFGPLKIIHIHEPSVNLKAVLVIDNVAKGPSIGGVRMAPDVSTKECIRLARAMTFKNIVEISSMELLAKLTNRTSNLLIWNKRLQSKYSNPMSSNNQVHVSAN